MWFRLGLPKPIKINKCCLLSMGKRIYWWKRQVPLKAIAKKSIKKGIFLGVPIGFLLFVFSVSLISFNYQKIPLVDEPAVFAGFAVRYLTFTILGVTIGIINVIGVKISHLPQPQRAKYALVGSLFGMDLGVFLFSTRLSETLVSNLFLDIVLNLLVLPSLGFLLGFIFGKFKE